MLTFFLHKNNVNLICSSAIMNKIMVTFQNPNILKNGTNIKEVL